MVVEISIAYEGQLHCRATHGPSGQTLTTDAPKDNGGKGEAFSPTDLVAAALGTCMVTIMGLFAQRSGLDISGTQVRVVKEMAAEPARRLGTLRATITLPKGRTYPPEVRQKLERAANACPVKQSLHPDIEIHTDFVYPA
jgi:putative redox protein